MGFESCDFWVRRLFIRSYLVLVRATRASKYAIRFCKAPTPDVVDDLFARACFSPVSLPPNELHFITNIHLSFNRLNPPPPPSQSSIYSVVAFIFFPYLSGPVEDTIGFPFP